MNYKKYFFFILSFIFCASYSLGVHLYIVNSINSKILLESINQDKDNNYTSFNCIENTYNTPILSPKIEQREFSNPELVGGKPIAITVAEIPANSVTVFTINPTCNINKGNLFDNFTLNKSDNAFTDIYSYRNLAVDYQHKVITGFTAESSVNYLFSYMASEDISVVLNII